MNLIFDKGSTCSAFDEKTKVRFEEPLCETNSNNRRQKMIRQKSLSRTMSASALGIRKRRSFWSSETHKAGL